VTITAIFKKKEKKRKSTWQCVPKAKMEKHHEQKLYKEHLLQPKWPGGQWSSFRTRN